MRNRLSLLTVLVLFAGCNAPGNQTAPNERHGSGTNLTTESGSVSDSPNEKTPTTVDSLEVPVRTVTINTSVTASGTILFGNPENPNRLIVFSDYDCVYCRKFLSSDLPWIEQESIASDELAIELVTFPLSKEGNTAAALALCSAEQQKFREANTFLSTNGARGIDLKKFAKATGVNLSKLTQCTARKNLLAGNAERAKEYNVERVPFFVLGTDSWLGLLQREELQEGLRTNLE